MPALDNFRLQRTGPESGQGEEGEHVSAHFDTSADTPAIPPDPAEKWLLGLGRPVQDGLVWHHDVIGRAADAAAAVEEALRCSRLEAYRLLRSADEPFAHEVRRMHQDLFGQWVLLHPRQDDTVLAVRA